MTKNKQIVHKDELLIKKPKEVFEKELLERISIGTELLERKIKFIQEVNDLNEAYTDWHDYNIEFLKRSFTDIENEYGYRYSKLNQLSGLTDYYKGIDTKNPAYILKNCQDKIKNSLDFLNRLLNKLPLIPTIEKIESFQTVKGSFSNIGFVVHGHNDALKFEVANYLREDLEKKSIILHMQPSQGRTVIEKFEKYSDVDFAVALWTSDDLGKAKDDKELKPRARQNVIFETGFFIGKIGRENVIILYETGIEIPSDYSGVVYIALEGNWKDTLRKEILSIYNK